MTRYPMDPQLRAELLPRLERDLGLRLSPGTHYLRKGECPACHQRELFTDADAPWVVKCGREARCGQSWHVKELFADLFDDWSERFKPSASAPAASADGYLQFARGFDLGLIKGWYSQETYWDRAQGIGSATVRFPLAKGGYWERLIDRPARFGKQKARFQPGASYKGVWWCPPDLDLLQVEELWIVEGIFDAIALRHHGLAAVSAMSSNAYPEESLQELARLRGGRLPRLVWALDNEPGAQRYTRRWVRQARALGYPCTAAQIPQPGRKLDWNDLHQRWAFEPEATQRDEQRERDLAEARHHGALLLAETASAKAVLLYEWRERHEFHFTFDNRLYWFKLDLDKYNKALTHLEESERDEDRQLTSQQQRDKAMRLAGNVVEIANCAPQALYFQRNEITDESWYYFRVDFPHDGPAVKNTFTGAQVAAASEFKKRLLGMAAGAVFTGSGTQLDKLMKDQLFGLKTVETIDYVGYSREHGCYVFGDLAVRDGQLHRVNDEDYFDFGRLRLKTLQKTIGLKPNPAAAGDYRSDWLPLLWTCFGSNGLTALTFWFGSLFAEQLRARYQSFPFLEATGEAGAGKTTLLTFLWKLFGRAGYEGFDPSKSSTAGRSRAMGQVAGMPIVLIEGDRNDPEKAHAKSFDWDELKDFFGGGTLRTRGMKTAGNETYEPPFRGTIAISQNAPVSASEAILTRIVKLHFTRPVLTDASRAAADSLSRMDGGALSHFLLLATRREAEVLALFHEAFPRYEAKLRRLGDHCFCCGAPLAANEHRCRSCQNELIGHLRIERIVKNHAMLLALLDGLGLVVELPPGMVAETQRALVRIALERQAAISADHPAVTEFWQVYDYLQSLSGDPVVNHSLHGWEIAINLNEFVERAAEHRQRLADLGTLRELLKDSRQFRFIDNKVVTSRIRALQKQRNPLEDRPDKVRCWVFANPHYSPAEHGRPSSRSPA